MPLTTLVKLPSIVVFVTVSPFASVNVVVTRDAGLVTSVKTDGAGGSAAATATGTNAQPAGRVQRSTPRLFLILSPLARSVASPQPPRPLLRALGLASSSAGATIPPRPPRDPRSFAVRFDLPIDRWQSPAPVRG